MKTQLHLFLLLFISATAFAQTKVVKLGMDTVRTPVPGMKNAEVISVYNNDSVLILTGMYVNGIKEGTWKSYHYNGCLQKLENYKSGEFDGTVLELTRDGNLTK